MRSSNRHLAGASGRRWALDEIAPDFTELDVWPLPVFGAREDFDEFLEMVMSWDPSEGQSVLSRLLFDARRGLGAMLGWDDPSTVWPIPGCTETTLHSRLPEDLRATVDAAPSGNEHLRRLGAHLVGLYRTGDEAAAEISNATVHGVLQFRWVERRAGRYQAQLAVYVKPRGLLGRAYLVAIQPFRHLVVYPALLRQFERMWASHYGRRAVPAAADQEAP